MTRSFGDVNARARGIGSRLLPASRIHELSAVNGLAALEAGLVQAGYPAAVGGARTAAELDRLVGRVAAARLALLGRWLGSRRGAFRAQLERRDLLALRAILRGAAEGSSAIARLQGVQPSPLFPWRLLERLAAADSLHAVHQVLTRAAHPAAAVFAPPQGGAPPHGLLALELSARQWWAARVVEGVHRAGRELRGLAAEIIDHENLLALLLAPAWGVEVGANAMFLVGGRRVGREQFGELAQQPDPDQRRRAMAALYPGAVGRILADAGIPLTDLTRRLRAASILSASHAARLSPLGPVPTYLTTLRIEAEAEDLRRVIHGVVLGAPAVVRATGVLAAA